MARDYRVVAPDARGFGDSEWSDAYDADVFVDDLHVLLAALRIERPILCGNSMGGSLAYMYAGLHLDRVERLIVVDTGLGERPLAAGESSTAGQRAPAAPAPVARLIREARGPFKSPEDAAAHIPKAMGAAFGREMIEHNLKRAADGSYTCRSTRRCGGACR